MARGGRGGREALTVYPRTFHLEPGEHIIRIRGREAGARLDRRLCNCADIRNHRRQLDYQGLLA